MGVAWALLLSGALLATRNPFVDYILGGLSSIQSTLIFPIHKNVFIHSAGVWRTKTHLNDDGLEVSFGIIYLAPYLLARELTPLLESNGPDFRIMFQLVHGIEVSQNHELHRL
jgi:hypothetical protein